MISLTSESCSVYCLISSLPFSALSMEISAFSLMRLIPAEILLDADSISATCFKVLSVISFCLSISLDICSMDSDTSRLPFELTSTLLLTIRVECSISSVTRTILPIIFLRLPLI